MNAAFEKFLTLPEPERRGAFQSAAARLNTLDRYAEKDFWVCLVLDCLYNCLPEGHPEFLFKGGTSLSKAFGLIRRFSEDIDVAVSPKGLGFSAGEDPTIEQNSMSRNDRKVLLDKLQGECSSYMQGRLIPALQSALGGICSVISDPADSGGQTLLIEYPTLYPGQGAGYVRPQVKIEGGARSARGPDEIRTVRPYIADDLKDGSQFEVCNLRTLAPEYTYLDKILILHGRHCGYRDEKRAPKDENRESRHYYDVAMMTETGAGRRALADRDLLASVRGHSRRTFRRAWQKLEEAAPGTVRLIPQPELREIIKKDYGAMQDMILDEAPDFDWVMEQIRTAEREINR